MIGGLVDVVSFEINCCFEVLEAVDKLLRDIVPTEHMNPFGGKVMLLGGDWKQLLPVVKGAYSSEVLIFCYFYHFIRYEMELILIFGCSTTPSNDQSCGNISRFSS